MIRNYLKVAFRYLLRHKGYSFINILGLAVGVTCCILILLFVRSEWSYDKFHSKSNRLYRAWQVEKIEGQDFVNVVTPLPLGPAMRASFPEVENECRVFAFNPMIKLGPNSFSEDVRVVDSTFFQLFDFGLEAGNRDNPFPTSNSVIITSDIAKKFFGNAQALGRTIEMQLGNDKVLFTVSAIAKPSPENSSIKYKLLIPYSNARYLFRPGMFTSWTNIYTETYVLLRENVKAATLEKKFPSMVKQGMGEDYREGAYTARLQPMTAIHLDTNLPAGNEPISNPKYAYILSTIGLLLLVIACINFITLSIGRSTTRALEVGVRKTMGAERRQLIFQYWGEAFLLTLTSVIIGLVLASLLVKPFNQLIARDLSLRFDPLFCAFCIGLIVLIAFISGIYPSIVLSRFNPVEVLKGKLRLKGNSGWLRQSLVVGQFAISIAMIICTMTIGRQMSFLKNKDLGFNKEQMVVVETHKGRKDGIPLGLLYKTELLKHPQVADAAVSIYSLAEPSWINLGFTDEKKVYRTIQYNTIDPYFIKAMNLQMAEGRAFDPANPADVSSSAIVNEAFVKEFGLTDPIGKKLPGNFEQQIIGVVKDFNFQSLHTKVLPVLLTQSPDSVVRKAQDVGYLFAPQPRISVRLKAGNLASNIDILKQAWKTVAPDQEFEYKFLDEAIAMQYHAQQRTSNIVQIASALSIFIACMGLFGLATLTVVRRTKEIGIRKVLGANVGTIIGLIANDFLKLVVIAAIFASPLAWWFMNDWLKDFAYRVNIGWWVFATATALAILIAFITISFRAIRAALANPVESLRTE